MKRSIRKKIGYLFAGSLIMLSFFMIAANFVLVYRSAKRNSEIMMSKSCRVLALELNDQFHLIEQTVTNLYEIAEEFRPAMEEMQSEAAVEAYVEQFTDLAIKIAENTEGALAVYYRINPDLTDNGTSGFFYVKSPQTGRFEKNEVTDLNEYDVNDMEHVGWYYVPVWAGEPVWMEPYYNANIDVEMISYVVPFYEGSRLLGVVGMDVDFNAIKEIAENVDIYKSNGAVLCSLGSSAVYYNHCDLFGNTMPESWMKKENSLEYAELACLWIDFRRYCSSTRRMGIPIATRRVSML